VLIMAKARGVEAKLSRLRTLRHEGAGPALLAELRQTLGDASNLVVAAAAEIVGARIFAELAPELAIAFERFMIDPVKRDKLCRAKTAIVDALNKLEYQQEDVFRRGIQHVQPEPVWGGTQDTAAQMRGDCAFGLVRLGCADVLILLVDLLLDKENVTRRAAAQALGASGRLAAVPLLRFKARVGDEDPAVIGECLTALMKLDAVESLAFVTEYLHAPPAEVQEGAAFALAESRRPEAFAILTDFWPRAHGAALQEVVLLAIAMMRLPEALDFLLAVLTGESRGQALAALAALRIHRHNKAIKERVAAAVAQTGDKSLQARFEAKFAAED
jgi:hypothetical protein